jgi:hypothetical protein
LTILRNVIDQHVCGFSALAHHKPKWAWSLILKRENYAIKTKILDPTLRASLLIANIYLITL